MGLPKSCSASEMFLLRDVPAFEALIRKQRYSLLSRFAGSCNFYVTAMYHSDAYLNSSLFKLCEQTLSANSIHN